MTVSNVVGEQNGLGLTPPMGWNPYNRMKSSDFKWWPGEKDVLAQAAALKSSGLQALGYQYVNLDAGWSLRERDSNGRPQPNRTLYPNLASGGLAKSLEAQGFKFGIYSDSGTYHCGGHGPGSLGYEAVDAQTWADWGVSYLKYDNCNVPAELIGDPIPRYTAMSKALNATGRPIFFNMCEWGVADPAKWGAAVSNSWRTTAGISDEWWAMGELADLTAYWFDYAGPGAWNDPDLLEVGNGGMSTAEYRSHFAIWALLKAPLLLSTDVTALTPEALEIVSNAEVIALNQDKLGVAGRLVEERPPDPVHLQAWAAPLSAGRVAVVLWNRGKAPAEILCRFVNVQLFGSAAVRDLLAHADLGVMTGEVARNVSSHDVAVLLLTPVADGSGVPLAAGGNGTDGEWAARWRAHGIRVPKSRLAAEAAKGGARGVRAQQPWPRRLALFRPSRIRWRLRAQRAMTPKDVGSTCVATSCFLCVRGGFPGPTWWSSTGATYCRTTPSGLGRSSGPCMSRCTLRSCSTENSASSTGQWGWSRTTCVSPRSTTRTCLRSSRTHSA